MTHGGTDRTDPVTTGKVEGALQQFWWTTSISAPLDLALALAQQVNRMSCLHQLLHLFMLESRAPTSLYRRIWWSESYTSLKHCPKSTQVSTMHTGSQIQTIPQADAHALEVNSKKNRFPNFRSRNTIYRATLRIAPHQGKINTMETVKNLANQAMGEAGGPGEQSGGVNIHVNTSTLTSVEENSRLTYIVSVGPIPHRREGRFRSA